MWCTMHSPCNSDLVAQTADTLQHSKVLSPAINTLLPGHLAVQPLLELFNACFSLHFDSLCFVLWPCMKKQKQKIKHLEVFSQLSSCHRFCYCNFEIPKCNHQPHVYCNFPLQNEHRASYARKWVLLKLSTTKWNKIWDNQWIGLFFNPFLRTVEYVLRRNKVERS